MNCESCKNKHATVFYADEGGGRHALCQSCARTLGKISPYSPAEEVGAAIKPFIPEPTLLSLPPPHLEVWSHEAQRSHPGAPGELWAETPAYPPGPRGHVLKGTSASGPWGSRTSFTVKSSMIQSRSPLSSRPSITCILHHF